MKKFSFSLEKVLSYKEQVEDNCRNEHAIALKAVRDKEHHIRALEHEQLQDMKKYNEEKKITCNVGMLNIYTAYFRGLEKKIEDEKVELEKLRKTEEERRNKVIEAKKERMSIDILRERRLNEYNMALMKEEERIIEEFVANKSSRRLGITDN